MRPNRNNPLVSYGWAIAALVFLAAFVAVAILLIAGVIHLAHLVL